jgi:O-acetyl-ADP-ribose deacetylase (regulator of RNase III)
MKVLVGDIWKVKADYRGVPTNGCVTKAGNAVMGKGVALQAKQKFPGIERRLGAAIAAGGNRLHLLEPGLFSFPVKRNWRERADVDLIRQSVRELGELAERLPERTFAIPLPGTGNGGLEPDQVWPLLAGLPGNVAVVVYDRGMLPNPRKRRV